MLRNSQKVLDNIVTFSVLGSFLGIIVFGILLAVTWSVGWLYAVGACTIFLIGFYVREMDYRHGIRRHYDD